MFYIIDQGARIYTPIEEVLKEPLTVTRVQAVRPTQGKGFGESGKRQSTRNALPRALKELEPASPFQEDRIQVKTCADIMSTEIFTLNISDSIEQAWAAFRRYQFHHIPLLDEQSNLQGLLSDRDLLYSTVRGQDHSALADVASRRVVTALPEARIASVAEVMIKRQFGAMPVLGEGHNLLGMVTRTDILKAVIKQAPPELWA